MDTRHVPIPPPPPPKLEAEQKELQDKRQGLSRSRPSDLRAQPTSGLTPFPLWVDGNHFAIVWYPPTACRSAQTPVERRLFSWTGALCTSMSVAGSVSGSEIHAVPLSPSTRRALRSLGTRRVLICCFIGRIKHWSFIVFNLRGTPSKLVHLDLPDRECGDPIVRSSRFVSFGKLASPRVFWQGWISSA